MNPLVLLAAFFGVVIGVLFAFSLEAADRGRHTVKWKARGFMAIFVLFILAVAAMPAHAATVAEILNVAKFTDERGDCPRLYRVAIAPDGTRGCWTIGEIDRRILIRWPDGTTVEYSEIQFDIYAK